MVFWFVSVLHFFFCSLDLFSSLSFISWNILTIPLLCCFIFFLKLVSWLLFHLPFIDDDLCAHAFYLLTINHIPLALLNGYSWGCWSSFPVVFLEIGYVFVFVNHLRQYQFRTILIKLSSWDFFQTTEWYGFKPQIHMMCSCYFSEEIFIFPPAINPR